MVKNGKWEMEKLRETLMKHLSKVSVGSCSEHFAISQHFMLTACSDSFPEMFRCNYSYQHGIMAD